MMRQWRHVFEPCLERGTILFFYLCTHSQRLLRDERHDTLADLLVGSKLTGLRCSLTSLQMGSATFEKQFKGPREYSHIVLLVAPAH